MSHGFSVDESDEYHYQGESDDRQDKDQIMTELSIESTGEKFLDEMHHVFDHHSGQSYCETNKGSKYIDETTSLKVLEPDLVYSILKGFSGHSGTKILFIVSVWHGIQRNYRNLK